MTNQEASSYLLDMMKDRDAYRLTDMQAYALRLGSAALGALGASPASRIDELLSANAILKTDFAALDAEKCEMVDAYRAAEAKLERTWKIVELYQDRLAEDEAR